LKIFMFLALLGLCGCSWFHSRAKPPPDPTELIVTGAPAGSIVFIDDVQNGELAKFNDKPQVLNVSAGAHVVEVRAGTRVIYREQTYVGSGEKRFIRVLSGFNRE
jgi:hypothetical protein